MAKTSKVIFLIIVLIAVLGVVSFLTKSSNSLPDNQISKEEQAFNDSGQAKAILDETDLWKIYEDKDAGFSIKYPGDINFGTDQGAGPYMLFIESKNVDSLEGTMGYDKETALKNMASLESGQYGQNVDFPLESSKTLKKIGSTNAQEFMVLARFEVCDVTFERKLYFFNNNYQLVITLSGPKDSFIAGGPEYFTTDKENCGDEKIWNFEKQNQFYNDLKNNKAPQIIQDWFNIFDKIIGTVEIYNKENSPDFALLQGKWVSLGDANSKIEFNNAKKIDYYQDEKLSEDNFEIQDGKYLVVGSGENEFKYEITELTDKNLTMIYLSRGNTLKYQKSE